MGQQQARTRWGTHESGAAFDRKKTPSLSEQAQEFLTQQAFCVIAGLGPQGELGGLLAMGRPGFVQPVGEHQCLLQLDGDLGDTPLVQRLRQSPQRPIHLGLFFICHSRRQRLCVQGTAQLLAAAPPDPSSPQSLWQRLHKLVSGGKRAVLATRSPQSIWVRFQVEQSFFHCAKYIRTSIPGLTCAVGEAAAQQWWSTYLPRSTQPFLSEEVRAFLAKQLLCYLCTVDRNERCAVNHRGGAPGFLVSLPPAGPAAGGTILLPDYAGNGAFEALGNIFETGQAALVVPNYAAHVALCVWGSAAVLEVADLAPELASSCAGAERVVALSVRRVEVQRGDWSQTLAYERARAHTILRSSHPALACPL
jgi:hypothetical protein